MQGAKLTAQLIPLCHPLPLDGVEVVIELRGESARIETTARARAATGVEMEALTAAAVAALTIYDMCKAAGKGITIEVVRLLEKSGGRSGHWRRRQGAMAGRVETVCASRRHGLAEPAPGQVRMLADHGIEGDADAGRGHRQISLIDHAASTRQHPPTGGGRQTGAFAANVVLSGLDMGALGLGSRLRLGATATLSITRIGRSGSEPEPAEHRMPDGLLFARVIEGGLVAVGDPAVVELAIARSVLQIVVLTLSDRCAAGTTADTTGPAVANLLRERLSAHVFATEILPDGRALLAERLRHYADGPAVDLVVAAGGTGPGPRDETPEAVRDVVHRLTPGFDEAMRMASLAKTPLALLSRACSGIRAATLILSVPGSERGAVENLQAILPALPHCLGKLRGDASDCGRPPP